MTCTMLSTSPSPQKSGFFQDCDLMCFGTPQDCSPQKALLGGRDHSARVREIMAPKMATMISHQKTGYPVFPEVLGRYGKA